MKAAKKAFTLVELLVVISIVALLVALLLPSLRSARRIAKRSMCGNNLRQFGVALFSYANDSHDWFPSHSTDDATYNTPGFSGPGGYIYQIALYGNSTPAQAIDDASSPWGPYSTDYANYTGGGPRVWTMLVDPGYIIDWHILVCPNTTTSINGFPTPTEWFGPPNKYMTYHGCMSGKVDDPTRGSEMTYWWEPRKTLLHDVEFWSSYFGGGSAAGFNHAGADINRTGMWGPATGGYEGLNFLGVDGAVRWQSEEDDATSSSLGYRKIPY